VQVRYERRKHRVCSICGLHRSAVQRTPYLYLADIGWILVCQPFGTRTVRTTQGPGSVPALASAPALVYCTERVGRRSAAEAAPCHGVMEVHDMSLGMGVELGHETLLTATVTTD
jgi:hypothetical protein